MRLTDEELNGTDPSLDPRIVRAIAVAAIDASLAEVEARL